MIMFSRYAVLLVITSHRESSHDRHDAARRRHDAFLDPAAPSLASLLAALAAMDLPPRRVADLCSAVRSLCRVLGKTPGEVPADPGVLGRALRRALPATAGISPGPLGQHQEPGPAGLAPDRLPGPAGPLAPPAHARPGRHSMRCCRPGTTGPGSRA